MTGWLEAADRVTVKLAARVPVLPSVTVTSPIFTSGVVALSGVKRNARFG